MLKANIFEIKHFAVHDGDGIRTTVFFKGCPLRCKWCHNPEGLTASPILAYYDHLCTRCGICRTVCKAGVHRVEGNVHLTERDQCVLCGECVSECPQNALRIYGQEITVDELMPVLTAERPFYEESGGGVTLSGGECLLQADFCRELLKKLKEEGISTAVDTSGAVAWEEIEKVLPYTDRFLYDIKHMDPDAHREGTGSDNRRILDNLGRLFAENASVEIRIPLIPGYNDDCINEAAEFLSDSPSLFGVRVLKYHRYAEAKYRAVGLKNTMPPAAEEDGCEKAKAILASRGIRVLN